MSEEITRLFNLLEFLAFIKNSNGFNGKGKLIET